VLPHLVVVLGQFQYSCPILSVSKSAASCEQISGRPGVYPIDAGIGSGISRPYGHALALAAALLSFLAALRAVLRAVLRSSIRAARFAPAFSERTGFAVDSSLIKRSFKTDMALRPSPDSGQAE